MTINKLRLTRYWFILVYQWMNYIDNKINWNDVVLGWTGPSKRRVQWGVINDETRPWVGSNKQPSYLKSGLPRRYIVNKTFNIVYMCIIRPSLTHGFHNFCESLIKLLLSYFVKLHATETIKHNSNNTNLKTEIPIYNIYIYFILYVIHHISYIIHHISYIIYHISYIIYYISYIIYHILYIIYYILYIIYYILYIIYYILYIIYYILYIIYYILYIIYHISYIIYHISYIIYHISYIIYHISYIIYHISYIIYHISYIIYYT